MKSMKRLLSFRGADRNERLPPERVVQDDADAPDGEREDEALDVESRAFADDSVYPAERLELRKSTVSTVLGR